MNRSKFLRIGELRSQLVSDSEVSRSHVVGPSVRGGDFTQPSIAIQAQRWGDEGCQEQLGLNLELN